jgi:hypothetical protein
MHFTILLNFLELFFNRKTTNPAHGAVDRAHALVHGAGRGSGNSGSSARARDVVSGEEAKD